MKCRSEWQRPATAVRISTSRGPGFGRLTSSITSGLLTSIRTAAFIGYSLNLVLFSRVVRVRVPSLRRRMQFAPLGQVPRPRPEPVARLVYDRNPGLIFREPERTARNLLPLWMMWIMLRTEQALKPPGNSKGNAPMAESYRIFGAEMSPYSVKVRSYFRYKDIPHHWILRNAENQAEYEKHAKLPIVPLVVTPRGSGMQDSTPIIDKMEMLFPQPSIHPEGVSGFISELIEEFGDEWGNKWMFHYRWSRDVDQRCSAGRIARMRAPKASETELSG